MQSDSCFESLPKPPSIYALQTAREEVAYELQEGVAAAGHWGALRGICRDLQVEEDVFLLGVYVSALDHFSKCGAFTVATFGGGGQGPARFAPVVADSGSGARSFHAMARQLAGALPEGRRRAARASGAAAAFEAGLVEHCCAFTAGLGAGGLRVEDLPLRLGGVRLHASAREAAGGSLRYWLSALRGSFPEELEAGIFATYGRLLAALGDAASWEVPIRRLLPRVKPVPPIVAPTEDLPQELLHEAFLRNSAEDASRLAILDTAAAAPLTYGKVEDLSRRVCAQLRPHVQSERRIIAVMLDKGWRQPVAVLGVLRAQCAYMPVDSMYSRNSVERMVMLSAAPALVSERAVLDRAPWLLDLGGLLVLSADDLVQGPIEVPQWAFAAGPRDLAYLLYTSGTTGTPKGVACHHQGAVNTNRDLLERFQLGPGDRVLACPSSLNFDLSVFDIFGTLAAGGAMVIPPKESVNPPRADVWLELICSQGVSIWSTVPAILELVVAHAEQREWALPPSFRLAFMSGDFIPLALPARIRALSACQGLRVISMGGATEAAIWSNTYEIGAEPLPGWSSVPYGVPMKNQTMYILDQNLDHCEPWVTGIIHIGGTGVALGYYKDPERSARQFFHHPETGEWLFRTGDLGRMRPGGLLEILGREDMQVCVGGFRVELHDIERVLLEHSSVQDALVMFSGAGEGLCKPLVAFVTPKAVGRVEEAGERGWLDHGADMCCQGVPTATAALDRLRASSYSKVLELGHCDGPLLDSLAKQVERPWPTDPSVDAVERRRSAIESTNELDAQALVPPPHDLAKLGGAAYDFIVCNSAGRRFSSLTHFEHFIARVAGLLRASGGGVLYLRALHNFQLLEFFHQRRLLDAAAGTVSVSDLQATLQHTQAQDDELAVAPAWFQSLVGQHGITHARTLAHFEQEGRGPAAPSAFHFDAMLMVERDAEVAARGGDVLELGWTDLPGSASERLAHLEAMLDKSSEGGSVILRGVPNQGLRAERRVASALAEAGRGECTVAELRARLQQQERPGREGPEVAELWAIGVSRGCHVEATFAGGDAMDHDVLFVKTRGPWPRVPAFHTGLPSLPGNVANSPEAGRMLRVLPRTLAEFARERLPPALVPTAVVAVPAMPLTRNGKVDTKSLMRLHEALLAAANGDALAAPEPPRATGKPRSEAVALLEGKGEASPQQRQRSAK